ncbi:hypothetical protein GTS_46480 [Gandjariella thermophila]|uniref:Uncharacterized protein n=1 Tax=Gandjariella thermophila TaxID=1931992 RepID=A0A4D4J886_9PSEU|nr:hypothetical protein GTS_46480 [Gandjariella thermophila]
MLAAGALLVLAAGCGPSGIPGAGPTGAPGTGAPGTGIPSAPPGTGTSPAPIPPPVGTGAPAPPGVPPAAGGSPVPADRVDANGLPPAERTGVWTADGGRTVGIQEEQTGCTTLRLDVVDQNPQQVRLVLVSTTTTHQFCPHYVRQVSVTAALAAPLGDRTVVLTSRSETR